MLQLPPEVKAFAILFLTQGIKSLFDRLGVEFSGWVSVGVAAAVGAFLFFGEAVIASFDPGVQQAITAFLAILAAMGGHRTVKTLAPVKAAAR